MKVEFDSEYADLNKDIYMDLFNDLCSIFENLPSDGIGDYLDAVEAAVLYIAFQWYRKRLRNWLWLFTPDFYNPNIFYIIYVPADGALVGYDASRKTFFVRYFDINNIYDLL